MKNPGPIAIVGIGGIFPQSLNLDSFWKNILSGVNTSRIVPNDRWPLNPQDVYNPEKGISDKVYSLHGCFIENFDLNPEGLDLTPQFLATLDQMFHLTLHAGREAFKDAVVENLDRSRVGVIIGNIALPTEKSSKLAMDTIGVSLEEKVLKDKARQNNHKTDPINRFVAGLPAGMLAKSMGLGGGSYTLDAACASSLYALSLAADELLSGRADAMLTGGVSRPDCFYTQMGFSQLHALSPSGISAPFDKKANGLVVGEGAGMFLLKRLEDAKRDKDHIYACIRGVGLSNDVGGSMLAPASEGQLRAMHSAYETAGWSPLDVDMIECHATGTPLGDAVEFESLKKLWGDSGWEEGQCILGSIKSNIGHLLTAAGAAGLMKILLSIKHGFIPPTANFSEGGNNIDFTNSPFQVLKSSISWKKRDKKIPRRAALSAFGFGGINAHILIEEYILDYSPTLITVPSSVDKADIAIVGMDTHFGHWDSLDKFQKRIFSDNNNCEEKEKPKWWGAQESYWYKKQGLDRFPFNGFFINNIKIITEHYRIPPKELAEMLPQQLLMLKVAAGALKDTNLKQSAGLRTGIFIGIGLDLNTTNFNIRWMMSAKAREWAKKLGFDLSSDQMEKWIKDLRDGFYPPLNANRTIGALGNIVASRIAREFKIGGPSFTISSEESSAISSLNTAIGLLRNFSIDNALVGAVDFAGDIRSILGTHQVRHFSASGESIPFDITADGSIPGDGASAVIIKRLDDAIRDEDRIYSVIKGVGTSSGGGVSTHIPKKKAYLLAMKRAYSNGNINHHLPDLIETNASGFPDEDKMEAQALKDFFQNEKAIENRFCVLGSVKEKIGHTGAASGLSSLIKAALCTYHQTLPGTGKLKDVSPVINFQEVKFRFPTKSQYWLRNRAEGPRRADVSSFSMDGNCSYVTIEEFDKPSTPSFITPANNKKSSPLIRPNEGLFIIEGDDMSICKEAIYRLRELIQKSVHINIDHLAVNWWQQNPDKCRKKVSFSIIAKDQYELLDRLNSIENNLQFDSGIFFSSTPQASKGKIAFVYPGSGNHYKDMGRNISSYWPEILHKQDSNNLYLKDQYCTYEFWNKEPLSGSLFKPKTALMGQVAFGTLTTDIISSFGITPQAVIGYSLGETTGLFSLRAWKDRDEMLKRINNSTLFVSDLAGSYNAALKSWRLGEDKNASWVMGVVNSPQHKVLELLEGRQKVYLLIVNTPGECIIGGDMDSVNKLVKDLECNYFPLKDITISHCEVVKEVEKKYRDFHIFNTDFIEDIDFYSGAWGGGYCLSKEKAADSILSNAINGINFPELINKAYDDGVRIFLEMGPGATCTRMIKEILIDRQFSAQSISVQGKNEISSLLYILAWLISEGVDLSLDSLYGPEKLNSDYYKLIPEENSSLLNVKTGRDNLEVTLPDIQNKNITFSDNALVSAMTKAADARAKAHNSFLNFSNTLSEGMQKNLELQMSLLESIPPYEITTSMEPLNFITEKKKIFLDREKCMEFAIGKIANVLGPDYAEADTYPSRVRLPDDPLMLVDRILSISGEPKSLKSGKIITEHDIKQDAWYLDCGRIPTCIAVEAGQADLFLSGYLGIDFITKGLAVYRLLDAAVTFHDSMPGPGEVITYDINIENFFRQGDTYLFRFNFEAKINGRLFLTMKKGCAGFFTSRELATGKGIITKKIDKIIKKKKKPIVFDYLPPMSIESYSGRQLNLLRSNDLAGCFGGLFTGIDLTEPSGIPGGKMSLVDRVTLLDPNGGTYSSGLIQAEADIHPDDWFLTCHFFDDNVMPGTLMYECCLHTLRIYLLRMGWIGEHNEIAYHPVPGVVSLLKCRGQVIESTKKVTYEISIKEMGYRPEPFAIVDALMHADDKPVVEISDMSIRITGLSEERLKALWSNKPNIAKKETAPLFNSDSILAFAIGKPSEAFGDPYKIFDKDRIIARLPGPPFKFLDKITRIQSEPWKMCSGGVIDAEYHIPKDAWYFNTPHKQIMPFSILLEIALQPCGWLAAYIGSALTSDTDLCFRNLGGNAIQTLPIFSHMGTLVTTVKITNVSSSVGMIIQHFDFEVKNKSKSIYKGNTYFGFFTKKALSEQIGIRDSKPYLPSAEELAGAYEFEYPKESPFPDTMLRMIDHIEIFDEKGGQMELGFIQGTKDINPDEWFFKAHFFQDPVFPGSLGLESFLQLLKIYAHRRFKNKINGLNETFILNKKHTWVYRGQIIPNDKKVTVQATVSYVDDEKLIIYADGFLMVDGRTIYRIDHFGLQYVKAEK